MCGVTVGKTFPATEHFHSLLLRASAGIPDVRSGDSVWWHPNTAKPIPQFALNFARNKDEAIGEKLDAARSETDPQKEIADYQYVQTRLAEDVPYIWLYHSQISIIARNEIVNVVNWTLPPNEQGERKKGLELQNGAHPLKQVWIKR